MFKPNYRITDRLLAYIKRINTLVNELNNQRFPDVVLVAFEKTASAVSAYASTSIEGNPLPLIEVKKILKSTPSSVRTSEKEVINYNNALHKLNKELAERTISLSLELILEIQKNVMDTLLPEYELGRLRKKPVVVNDPKTGNAVYLPPDAKDVPELMNDLVQFVYGNKGKVDPLILAGIFHKQMVIIHPFMDGNGRTTRLATKVLLAEMGLNTFNLFSFENYYNNNVSRYFQTVGEFGNYYELTSHIDFTSWLEYFTEGIIDELLRVSKLLLASAVSPKTKLKPYQEKLLAFIRKEGFITDRDYTKLTDRAKSTRALDFKLLIEFGMIERKGKGKATYYVLKTR